MDRPQEGNWRQDGKRDTVIVLSSDSDGDDDLLRAPDRDKTSSKKQHKVDSGSQLKSSQSQPKHRSTGFKSPSTVPRTDSRNKTPDFQQQSTRSIPSEDNLTLAQRVASRDPVTQERSRSHRAPQSMSMSKSEAGIPSASQVQISRALSRANSTVLGGVDSGSTSPGPSSKSSKTKRRFECDGEIEESPAGKRLKFSHGRGQPPKQAPTTRHRNRLSTAHHSSGSGIGSNPIVILDSPPPEIHQKRPVGDLLPASGSPFFHPPSPQQSQKSTSKSAGRTSTASVLKPRAISLTIQRGSQRETAQKELNRTTNSPIIPESLPGSPERNEVSTVTNRQLPSMSLFIQSPDETSDNHLGTDIEMISGFAEQAEALLASQSHDIPPATATAHMKPQGNDRAVPRPSSSSLTLDSRAASQSSKQDKHCSTAKEPPENADQTNRSHTKPIVLPVVRTNGHELPNTTFVSLTPANHIEQVMIKYDQELRNDNSYWTRTWLHQARHATTEVKKGDHAPTSVFRDMLPIEPMPISADNETSDLFARFSVEKFYGGGKTARRSFAVPCTMYSTPTEADVPNYSHFVNIKHSFLAHNETVLQHWPYFHDEFDIREARELDVHYFLDVVERERKIKRLASAENYAAYAEDILREIECSWSDVLRFLLDPRPNVGNNSDALDALRNRHKYCEEDFVRSGQRWTTVLSKLPESKDPDRIGRAALLCEHFQKVTKLQLWHVARRSAYTTSLLQETNPKLDLHELTCRVCMRFSCPYHGEMHENASAGSDIERDGSAADDVVEKDIIHPHRVNYRSRVAFPAKVDTDDVSGQVEPRRKKLDYWQKLNLNHYPDGRRGPFYPCYHPGATCEKSQCSCHDAKIPCEKSCACTPSCKRKWQGCDCRMKGGRICFEDARCACFQNGRECDADLCGDCGVSEVLDPVHRHDETILRGRCSNASIQRGVPRHTILGDSRVHGLGLYACEAIKHHDFVGEYKGEIITKEEAERRGAVYEHQKLSYLFSLNNRQEVDSTLFGSKIRFINHAPDKVANLYPRIIMVNTVFRIALYGACQIQAGDELLFDYGPQFPQDQLGVSGKKANKGGKAAPHVRNKNLVAQFVELPESFDNFGNRRAKKAAAGDKRGKSKGTGAALKGGGAIGERSLVAQKSALQTSSHRGGRPQLDRPAAPEDADRAQTPFDDMDLDAGQRLSSYNVADDDYPDPVQPDDDEDDDFAPPNERGNNDQGYAGSSSIDGDDEGEEEEEQEEEEAAISTRPRSSRRRR